MTSTLHSCFLSIQRCKGLWGRPSLDPRLLSWRSLKVVSEMAALSLAPSWMVLRRCWWLKVFWSIVGLFVMALNECLCDHGFGWSSNRSSWDRFFKYIYDRNRAYGSYLAPHETHFGWRCLLLLIRYLLQCLAKLWSHWLRVHSRLSSPYVHQ